MCAVWKTDVKNLQDVFYLTDRKPVPVNFFLCPTNMPSVLFHQYCSKLYFTLWEGDPPSYLLLVHRPYTYALLSHCLLQNSILDCARLACHGLGLRNIFYHSITGEEGNENIKIDLKPLLILQSHHAIFGGKES